MSAIQELLTGEQVAERLGLSRQRVQQLSGRPDFPPPAGRVGKATVWRAGDVDDYSRGIRRFIAINGVAVPIELAHELAVRLKKQTRTNTFPKASATVGDRLAPLLETGGSLTVAGEDAYAIFAALQTWLEQTNVDVFGERLMTLRYQLFGDLQDAGMIPLT